MSHHLVITSSFFDISKGIPSSLFFVMTKWWRFDDSLNHYKYWLSVFVSSFHQKKYIISKSFSFHQLIIFKNDEKSFTPPVNNVFHISSFAHHQIVPLFFLKGYPSRNFIIFWILADYPLEVIVKVHSGYWKESLTYL